MMSNETKWTPPPWRADLIGEEYTVEGMGNPSGSVAVVCSRRSVTGMADAHLIAAAPELYSELASANSQLEMAAEAIEAGRMDEALLHCRSMTRPRRAALAKARGETS